MTKKNIKKKFIPHNRPTLGKQEEKVAVEVIRSGWIAQGNAVENFENDICQYLGLPPGSAVAVSSGTAALYMTLAIYNAKEKNIAIPYYCCSSLRNAVTLAGGNPILVDSKMDSPNINMETIVPSMDIAIIPHLFGIPQKISKGLSKTFIIEDCAQSLGAYVDDVPIGLQGDVGIFSFYATKLITSGGQGGMIVSRDSAFIEELINYRTFNQLDVQKHLFNFQMTDLQAAIGSAQLRQFTKFMKRREEIYLRYQDANLPLLNNESGIQPVRFRAILQTPKQAEIITALAKNNITAAIPMQQSELVGSKDNYPNASYWIHNTVSLPIYPSLRNEDVKRIIKVVRKHL
ncbi:DegT/DnrJ/EryC1/StrS aminotransferase family protein [Solibacillus sp. MA9]|uniref:DegT/DnrJ/EryC1/StrS aminotransferase family protein n=1 Tax=Solibacillus palustris TaxID=2908203 RepID=A0ABS9UAJ3_9BACL|nr:DegT/DnrJ/EryC1/StrS aminotransferase family protein [Solibacillus sp. MA9]MCH7321352.1 DegT/DnrJ/EryC1/StrS aminotransferase family protein [Solibacillus sp. MA9]